MRELNRQPEAREPRVEADEVFKRHFFFAISCGQMAVVEPAIGETQIAAQKRILAGQLFFLLIGLLAATVFASATF